MIKLKNILTEESAMKAIINAKKGAKASGGGYSSWTKIGNNSWKNKKTGRLSHNAGLYDRIGEFSDFVIEGKLNEAKPKPLVSKKDIKDIEKSGNIDIAYKKAMALLKSLSEGNVNEYGGAEFSKITALQNFLTIDLDKFEKGLKDSKHKAIYKKARKQFMRTVSAVAFEHSKLHEGKLDADVKVYGRDFTHVNESYNQSDVDYAMKMAFDNIPGNWHKALKRVKYSKRSKSVKLNMSSYMGPGKVLQKIVDEFNKSMGTKYKIDKDSFVKGSITSIELRER